jgi:hypothetical protein
MVVLFGMGLATGLAFLGQTARGGIKDEDSDNYRRSNPRRVGIRDGCHRESVQPRASVPVPGAG